MPKTLEKLNNGFRKLNNGLGSFFTDNWKLMLLAVILLVIAYFAISIGISDKSEGGHELALHLGADLVISVLTFLVFERLLARAEEARIRSVPKLPHQKVVDNIGASSRISDILILESWTNLFDEDKVSPKDAFKNAIQKALKNKCSIKILILRPGSSGMNTRQKNLDGDDHIERVQNKDWTSEKDAELQSLENFRLFHEILSDKEIKKLMLERGSIEVRLYDDAPTIALYQWDNKGYASLFPPDKLSDVSEQIDHFVDSDFGRFLKNHFESQWKRSCSLETEMYKKGSLIWTDGTLAAEPPQVYFVWNDNTEMHLNCIAGSAIQAVFNAEKEGHLLYFQCEGKKYKVKRDDSIASRMTSLFATKYGFPFDAEIIFTLEEDSFEPPS